MVQEKNKKQKSPSDEPGRTRYRTRQAASAAERREPLERIRQEAAARRERAAEAAAARREKAAAAAVARREKASGSGEGRNRVGGSSKTTGARSPRARGNAWRDSAPTSGQKRKRSDEQAAGEEPVSDGLAALRPTGSRVARRDGAEASGQKRKRSESDPFDRTISGGRSDAVATRTRSSGNKGNRSDELPPASSTRSKTALRLDGASSSSEKEIKIKNALKKIEADRKRKASRSEERNRSSGIVIPGNEGNPSGASKSAPALTRKKSSGNESSRGKAPATSSRGSTPSAAEPVRRARRGAIVSSSSDEDKKKQKKTR